MAGSKRARKKSARKSARATCSSTHGKKHPCKGCGFCQWCSDSRCDVCRGETSRFAGMSFEEQIALYDKINKSS